MKKSVLFSFLVVWSVLMAHADLPEPALSHHKISILLSKKIISAGQSGIVDIPFNRAEEMFNQHDFILRIQEAYAALLPEGETPEFIIQQDGEGLYSYTNKKNQDSRIEEVLINGDGESELRLILFTEGTRFFGDFEAVVDIRVWANGESKSYYEVDVYALPHNGVSRFLARHLNLVQRFFNRKTDDLAKLSEEITQYMAKNSVSG